MVAKGSSAFALKKSNMKNIFSSCQKLVYPLCLWVGWLLIALPSPAQTGKTVLQYTLSMPEAAAHLFHVELHCEGLDKDTLLFKLPNWMPGYYQLMGYAKNLSTLSAKKKNGENIPVTPVNENSWRVILPKNTAFNLSYDVKAAKQFVANSFIDSSHAYIVPPSMFLYINGWIRTPVSLRVMVPAQWNRIATGLQPVAGKQNEFTAADFDILYDCPLLIGDLEELPSFTIKGIPHRFIGYKMGEFDRALFMSNLKKTVEAGIQIMGDIPYKQYTFIGIGPGRGGIEHLNNTTVSFDGRELNTDNGMNRMMNFLAHEYFHHYNVKRIRPLELGPFDYDRENRTNLLWVSEGLSVYYEYLIVKRAGLINQQTLLNNFANSITAFENDPGRLYQSLSQASYETWSDGPFGRQGQEGDRSISYYDKGPAVGMLLDFAIRHASSNKKSLDDVMRYLYGHYYKDLQRGFTDAEFQEACEMIAGIPLNGFFEYIYTTKELDYPAYLSYAGLKIMIDSDTQTGKRKITLQPIGNPDAGQVAILQSWLGE
ncbi:MAG: M61 family peptidase [Terrimonas sp.]|nr:M61 family peptidase [Terrimonas sp.]